jgi:HSP20 family protein
MADTAIEVKKTSAPAAARPSGADALQSFRNEVDRLFDQFWRIGFGLPSLRRMFEPEPLWRGETTPFSFTAPMVDFSEDDKAFHITADLPGMNEKDINVTLSGDMLTITGERREETEEKERNYYFSERRFGSFRRAFSLPEGVDRDKIDATFKNGVLSLTLPKTAEAMKQQKKIDVKAQ